MSTGVRYVLGVVLSALGLVVATAGLVSLVGPGLGVPLQAVPPIDLDDTASPTDPVPSPAPSTSGSVPEGEARAAVTVGPSGPADSADADDATADETATGGDRPRTWARRQAGSGVAGAQADDAVPPTPPQALPASDDAPSALPTPAPAASSASSEDAAPTVDDDRVHPVPTPSKPSPEPTPHPDPKPSSPQPDVVAKPDDEPSVRPEPGDEDDGDDGDDDSRDSVDSVDSRDDTTTEDRRGGQAPEDSANANSGDSDD